MGKTEETINIEKSLWKFTNKMGVFGCFEVTIGLGGKERVDYMTVDTKGIWRCYEIKVSKSDFYSAAKKTFVGNYNYYVMPSELYEIVKDDIPSEIGVIVGSSVIKKPKKQSLLVDEMILRDSMIRSLSRDTNKYYKMSSRKYIERINKEKDLLEKEVKYYKGLNFKYLEVIDEISKTYGLERKEIRDIIRKHI